MAVMPVAKQDFVSLEPFVHQVGGHSSMMKFDDVSVCKPLNQREHRFYEELPSEMHPFTPKYRGVVYVSFEEDEDGYIHLTAHPNKLALECQNKDGSSKFSCSTNGSSSDSDSSGEEVIGSPQLRSPRVGIVGSVETGPYRVRLRSGKLELISTRNEGFFDAGDMTDHSSDHASHGWPENEIFTSCYTGRNSINGSAGANPWSLHCHKEEVNKMRKLGPSSKAHKYIVLENVAFQFSSPCILDLKMGTRQHGDDATGEKRDRLIAKVEKSTSKTLGIRACGMQVYKKNSGRFMCHNKYHGLKLREEGFKEELITFLHNGQQFRTELIEPLLQRLRKLYKVIEKQHSFRFYSSSLLLMYEGDMDDSVETTKSCSSTKEREKGQSKAETPTSNHSNLNNISQCFSHRCKVDVRMIDFAHTTHSGFSGDRTRTGPDTGYLFGLKNLIRLLEDIQEKYHDFTDTSPDSNL
ncbi:inositol hexakisphosphate kinase 2-like isoform X1 [Stylophora pistillata]|uniref:Kinase n=1 Tax=Stylophora pistillata TaxID=50429 RepID=A0A2B4SWP0_STYPI|nr:inositol hexakisphosphate kinase 2-like isoform X1 [Stylophora pistillata]PFX33609.1 Inositol hexakisphosphate kinase 1 [Stylophora pistillata]